MKPEKWRSLPAMLLDQASHLGPRPFLWRKQRNQWSAVSWDALATEVVRGAAALTELGIGRGDRVALVAENSPSWIAAHFAIMACGAVSVPGYTTSTPDDYLHLLEDSGAKAVVVSTETLGRRLLPAMSELPGLDAVLALAPWTRLRDDLPTRLRFLTRAEFLDTERPGEAAVGETVASLDPDDIACLLYTSGTGGRPKGAMLTHRNILANCRGARIVLDGLDDRGEEIFLSFLPLNHAYEHMAGLMFPVSLGAQIYLSGGADSLAAELRDVEPTIMTAVPRLFETLHRRIVAAGERDPGIRRALFRLCCRLGTSAQERRLTMGERLAALACDRLVASRIRARFGRRLKVMISGGAPLNPEVGRFFLGFGIRVLQGYGQTETAPVVAVNAPRDPRADTVGRPLVDVEVKIAGDGEILVRGPSIMKGYWNDPAMTAQTLRDGWLHTGDVGRFEPDGHLRITDRKRDFIKNSGGEMISPQRIEGYLTLQPEIAQAMAYGDQRPYIVALLVPDDETRQRVGGDLTDVLAAAVETANRSLPPAERIRRFALAREPFTVSNGMMTPTLKIRRGVIRTAYRDVLEALYVRETA